MHVTGVAVRPGVKDLGASGVQKWCYLALFVRAEAEPEAGAGVTVSLLAALAIRDWWIERGS